MTSRDRLGNGRAARGVLLLAALAISIACGRDGDRALVPIDVRMAPALQGVATPVDEVELSVRGATSAEVVRTFRWPRGAALLQAGVYLPAGAGGSVEIRGRGHAAGEIVAETEVATAQVRPGSAAALTTLTLHPRPAGATADGGRPARDAEAPDGPDARGGASHAPSTSDAGARDAQGFDAGADRPEAARDAGAERPSITDAAPGAAPDLRLPPPAEPPTLARCTEYDHGAGACDVPKNLGTWAVRSVKFSPDGKFLVTAAEDGRAKVWRVTPTGLEADGRVFMGNGSTRVAFSPDGTLLALGSRAGALTLVDFARGTLLGTLAGHEGQIYALAFTADGSRLVTADSEKSLRVWDVATRASVRSYALPANAWAVASAPMPTPAGPSWVAAGLSRGQILVFDVAAPDAGPKRSFVATAMEDAVNDLAFAPDGRTLAVAAGDGRATLWDTANLPQATPLEPPALNVDPQSQDVSAVAFFADGKHVAAAASSLFWGGAVKVVALRPPAQRASAVGTYVPTSIDVSPDGRAVVAGEFNCGKVFYCRD
jgi:hypothetical protein